MFRTHFQLLDFNRIKQPGKLFVLNPTLILNFLYFLLIFLVICKHLCIVYHTKLEGVLVIYQVINFIIQTSEFKLQLINYN